MAVWVIYIITEKGVAILLSFYGYNILTEKFYCLLIVYLFRTISFICFLIDNVSETFWKKIAFLLADNAIRIYTYITYIYGVVQIFTEGNDLQSYERKFSWKIKVVFCWSKIKSFEGNYTSLKLYDYYLFSTYKFVWYFRHFIPLRINMLLIGLV